MELQRANMQTASAPAAAHAPRVAASHCLQRRKHARRPPTCGGALGTKCPALSTSCPLAHNVRLGRSSRRTGRTLVSAHSGVAEVSRQAVDAVWPQSQSLSSVACAIGAAPGSMPVYHDNAAPVPALLACSRRRQPRRRRGRCWRRCRASSTPTSARTSWPAASCGTWRLVGAFSLHGLLA